MTSILTTDRFNYEVRAKSTIGPERKRLLEECEVWLLDVAEALGFTQSVRGFDVFEVEWGPGDGEVWVHAYLPNEDGKRYVVGEGADRRVASKWFECPVPPPAGLKELAVFKEKTQQNESEENES